MIFTRTTDAITEPITRDEAKKQCRVEGTYEDAEMDALITTARQQLEKDSERSFLEQTWKGEFDQFPSGDILLPFGPVKSVTSIKYYSSGTQETLAPANYRLDKSSTLARIEIIDSWPSADDRNNAIEVIYITGYTTVPEQIKHAIKAQVLHLYHFRGDGKVGAVSPLARDLIHDFKAYESVFHG
jgi:uncharacterized phiE125 gp8 family phage protein